MPRLTPENKELHIAQMRENICRVFAEMFAADGDVSMESLAEKTGIAKGTIYNYFKDKKELTAAVMENRRRMYRIRATMLIAGLAAEGHTEVVGIGSIERGYDDIVGKLTCLGAKIKKVYCSDENELQKAQ